MGSDSDLPVMREAAEALESFGVPFEMTIASAHRSPERSAAYAAQARAKGLKVIICGAGMSAHLAGVMAAGTTLPVIGVPLVSGALQGLDALLSTIQMPPGVPVAAVGLGAARNAALLAVQILAASDPELRESLISFKAKMVEAIEAKNRDLQTLLAKEEK
jgi:phosphoribosylaminoimidazole carboxylase PurE protein